MQYDISKVHDLWVQGLSYTCKFEPNSGKIFIQFYDDDIFSSDTESFIDVSKIFYLNVNDGAICALSAMGINISI